MTKHPTKPPSGGQLKSSASGYDTDPVRSGNLLAAAAGLEVPRDNVVPFSTRKAWRDDT